MEPRTRRRDPWPWVGFACAVSFVVLGALVTRGDTVGLDTWLAALVRDVPVPTAAWVAISDLGGPLRVPIAIGSVLAAAALERLPPALIVRLLLIVGTVFLVAPVFLELAKDYVARPRPPDPLVEAAGWAFPSGHVRSADAGGGNGARDRRGQRLRPVRGAWLFIGRLPRRRTAACWRRRTAPSSSS